jgi:hypothetical protein
MHAETRTECLGLCHSSERRFVEAGLRLAHLSCFVLLRYVYLTDRTGANGLQIAYMSKG